MRLKLSNSDYYFQSEDAINALTDKFLAKAQENGLKDIASVPDYKAKGLNLYYNFNSAVSNDFNLDDRYVIEKDQVPPKDFQWFFQTGGNDSDKGKVTSMAAYSANGTLEKYRDFTTPGFDPMDPLKGTCWAAYKDENGEWQYSSADFEKKVRQRGLEKYAGPSAFFRKNRTPAGGCQPVLKEFAVLSPGDISANFPSTNQSIKNGAYKDYYQNLGTRSGDPWA